jgi:hypothetical protein
MTVERKTSAKRWFASSREKRKRYMLINEDVLKATCFVGPGTTEFGIKRPTRGVRRHDTDLVSDA